MRTTHDWSQTFVAHSVQHLVVVLACFAFIAAICVLGRVLLARDLRDGVEVPRVGRERTLRVVLAWSILISQAFIHLRRLTPERWDIDDSLPLHMCRLGVWIAAWLLLTLDTRARSLTLFWGIGLSGQIFATPYLDEGHASLTFWIYWINHVQIVGVGIYDIVVLGYRPTRRDLRFAIVLGAIYTIVVVAINALLGTNYSYLGAGEHDGASIVDVFGPYPMRIVWMSLSTITLFVLIYAISRGAMTLRTRVLGKAPPRRIDRAPSTTVDR